MPPKNPFLRVTPTDDQAATMAGLGKKLASLYEDIDACLPTSHYKADALKTLELVGMLTNKGVTHAVI